MSIDLGITLAVVSILVGMIGIGARITRTMRTISESAIMAHERDCRVRPELREEMRETEHRLDARLAGIEEELRSLNHYLRNGRSKG